MIEFTGHKVLTVMGVLKKKVLSRTEYLLEMSILEIFSFFSLPCLFLYKILIQYSQKTGNRYSSIRKMWKPLITDMQSQVCCLLTILNVT